MVTVKKEENLTDEDVTFAVYMKADYNEVFSQIGPPCHVKVATYDKAETLNGVRAKRFYYWGDTEKELIYDFSIDEFNRYLIRKDDFNRFVLAHAETKNIQFYEVNNLGEESIGGEGLEWVVLEIARKTLGNLYPDLCALYLALKRE